MVKDVCVIQVLRVHIVKQVRLYFSSFAIMLVHIASRLIDHCNGTEYQRNAEKHIIVNGTG